MHRLKKVLQLLDLMKQIQAEKTMQLQVFQTLDLLTEKEELTKIHLKLDMTMLKSTLKGIKLLVSMEKTEMQPLQAKLQLTS